MAAAKGNNYAREWTLENALPRFEDALKYAEENEECLCLQDAIFQTGIPYCQFYQLSKTEQVLNSVKENIQNAITKRINRNALRGFFTSAAAIWRMKQLGEKDQQYIDQNNTEIIKQEIIVNSEEAKKEIGKLIDNFEKE
jgi:hypothetical protein